MFEAFAVWFVTMILDIGAGTAIGAALVVATEIIITVGLSMAATRLLSPKMPTFSDLSGRGVMTRNPVAPRQLIYGQCKVSGPVVFLSTSGDKNQFLHIVVAVAGHQVEEIGDVYFNEDLVLSGSGDGYGSGIYSACLIHKKLGTAGQAVDVTLTADFPTDWDSTHTLSGIAYVYCKLTYNADVFPGGIPNVSCVVKGKLVYNPTGGATAYSANPALCLRDYLTDTDLGLGMVAAEIDDTAVAAAATICDQTVDHLPSGTEVRYACNGSALTSATPDSIIGQILSSMAGTIAYSGGKIVPLAGAYRTPTVTLDEAHLAGAFSVTTRASARDRINAIKGTYVSSANQWQASDFPSIVSTTYVTEDNSINHWRDVVLPFTTSSNAAQRIAIIQLRQAREEIVFTAKFNLNAMQLRAGDTVMITNTKLGWTAKVFEVIEWSFATDGTPQVPVVAMTLRETASTIYDWVVGDEIAVAGAPNTDLPDPFVVPVPTLSLLTDATTTIVQPDGTVQPRLKVSWTTPNDIHVENGGFVEIEYKRGLDSDYTVWAQPRGDALFDYITDVKAGVSYDVRARFQNNLGVRGAYDTESAAAIAGDTTVPDAPSGIACTAFPSFIELLWSPVATTTVIKYKIYRSTTSAVAGFSLRATTTNTAFDDTNVTTGTQYWYYIISVTASGIDSVASSVVTTTAITGAVGPGVVYRGEYSAATTYYHTTTRRDIVLSAATYWLTNNSTKNGTATWGTPGTDWESFGATFSSVATDILLAQNATILKTLVMGDGTADAGIIRAATATTYGGGNGFWMGYDSTTPKFRVGNPAGGKMSWDGSALTAGGFTIGATTLSAGSGHTKTTISSNANSGIVTGEGGSSTLALQLTLSDRSYFGVSNSGGNVIGELRITAATGDAQLIVGGGASYSSEGVRLLGATSKIEFGEIGSADANLYRSAANQLQTDDDIILGNSTTQRNLYVAHSSTTAGQIVFGTVGGTYDTNLYRSAANILKTDDALAVGGATIKGGGTGTTTLSDAKIETNPSTGGHCYFGVGIVVSAGISYIAWDLNGGSTVYVRTYDTVP